MLTISSGHSADYLLNAVATGPGELLHRRGGGGRAARALVRQRRGRARPDRAGRRRRTCRRSTSTTSTRAIRTSATSRSGTRSPPSATPAGSIRRSRRSIQRSLDAEPYADAERREQLRLDASKRARKNVAFLDVTFSVQKSVTILHAAFEAQEVKARNAGDEDAAKAWGEYRQAVEDAIWAGNNAGLDYLQQHAGYSRVGHHGGAAGRLHRRAQVDHRLVLPARLAQPRPAAAHPQHGLQPGAVRGRGVAHAGRPLAVPAPPGGRRRLPSARPPSG